MSTQLNGDVNVISNSNIEITYLDGDLNIIQKLDDEPNDVGGMTSSELKAKFDEGSNIIKEFINESLIPEILAADATEAERSASEAERVAAEAVRQEQESSRANAESSRVSAESERVAAESARVQAEQARVVADQNRDTAETARVAAENARVDAENARVTAEQKREALETGYVAQAKASAESAAQSESNAAQSEENASMSADNAESSAMTAMGYALGGSVSDPMGFVLDFPGTKYYAEVSKAYTEGGYFNPDPTGNNVTRQYVDGAENEAAKAQAFAEGGTYKEWEMTAPGLSTLTTKTVEKGAKQYAEEAERLALAASKSSRDATSSKVAAAESAAAAATSATAAINEADRAKAEADRAKDIVGGDYVTHPELEAALKNALPECTSSDNGKFLRVVDGAPAWATVQNAEEVEF